MIYLLLILIIIETPYNIFMILFTNNLAFLIIVVI